MDVTILIPCKNDKNNLSYVISDIKKLYNDIKILIVVSNKKDFDYNLLKIYSNLNIIYQNYPGYGAALIEGIKKITTKYFIIHNADGSFEVSKILEMYKLTRNFDFIFCDRYIKNAGSEDDTLLTFVGNKIFSFLSKFLLKINLNDVLYTHVLCNTKIVKDFNLKQNDFTFCIELPYKVFKTNQKVISLNTFEKKRISGKKNVNEFKDGFLILIFIFKLFFIRKFKR